MVPYRQAYSAHFQLAQCAFNTVCQTRLYVRTTQAMIHELVVIKDNTAELTSPKVAEQYRYAARVISMRMLLI